MLLIGSIALFIVFIQRSLPIFPAPPISSPTDHPSFSPPAPGVVPQPSPFSQEKLTEHLTELVRSQGVEAAMKELKRLTDNPKISAVCHSLVHEIGHAAYEYYQDVTTSLKYQDDFCGSGYIHGVIEERLGHSKNALQEMRSICTPKNGACLHGIGHGLMYFTDNDVPSSLQQCDSFATEYQHRRCAEGVFMENFTSDTSIHPSLFLDVHDPLSLCRTEKRHKEQCYFYAPRFFIRPGLTFPAPAISVCDPAEPTFRSLCLNGVGSAVMKIHIHDPVTAEELCRNQTGTYDPSCIQGMASYYLVHFNSLKKGRTLCALLQQGNQIICTEAVEARSFEFGD